MTELQQSSICLFLNKTEFFAERLKTSPVSEHWPDYAGPGNDLQNTTAFFKNKFVNLDKALGMLIHVHTTQSTDANSTRPVLDNIFYKSLQTRKNYETDAGKTLLKYGFPEAKRQSLKRNLHHQPRPATKLHQSHQTSLARILNQSYRSILGELE